MRQLLTKKEILTIPNALSMVRILLIPLFIWLYVTEAQPYSAALVVAASWLTDIADGQIARRRNQVSDLGKLLDPAADKLTQGAILFCLLHRYWVIGWVFVLLLLKELVQILLGYAAARVTGEVQAARWYGKASAGVFYVTMLLLLLLPSLPERGAHVLISLCAAALFLSMLFYARYYLNLIWGSLFPGASRRAALMQLLLLIVWAGVIVFCWLHRDAVTVDSILRITPGSPFLAALLLLFLFALKSLSVVIHCGFLYAAAGILFPLPAAIVINLLGTGVMALIPYFLGRRMGLRQAEQLVSCRKNFSLLHRFQSGGPFARTFLLRVINLLPYDLLSAYLGATEVPMAPYLLGSVLGMVSSCVLFPILGVNMTNPKSQEFVIALIIQCAITLAGLVGLWLVRRSAKSAGSPGAEASTESAE